MHPDPTISIPLPTGFTTLAQAGGVVTPALPAQPEAGPAPAGSLPAAGATTSAPGSQAAPSSTPQSQGPGMQPLIFIMLALVAVMFLPQIFGRKQQKQRAQMLADLKKTDRVQTVGGVIGTITELRDDEVVLKVDEGSNTRIRFARSAVQTVLKGGSGGAATPEIEVKAGATGVKV